MKLPSIYRPHANTLTAGGVCYSTSGFTIIELLMVLSLIGLLAILSAPVSLTSLTHTTLREERDTLVSLVLLNSRAAALMNKDYSAHGVFINQTDRAYVLFTGTTYTPDATGNRTIPFTNRSVTVQNSGGDTILFAARTGEVVTGTGTISIGNGTATHTVTLNNVGQIDW